MTASKPFATIASIAALALVGTTAAAQVAPGQPFIADDFESGIDAWTTEGSTGSVAFTSDAFQGAGALEVGYAQDFHGAKSTIALDPANRLTELDLGFVYKASASSQVPLPGVRATLVEFSPSGTTIHSGDFLFATSTWQASPATTFTLSRPDADALALIFQGHSNRPGAFIVDGVTLTNVPEPASLAAIGGAGVLMLRRRR